MDLHQWLNIAESAAVRGGEVLRRAFNQGGFRAWEKKAEWGLVTEADLEADRTLREFFQAATPDVPVLSEEGDTRYPEDAEGVWMVDPLDGTTNFAAGLPWWGVLVAYVHQGHPLVAAMYFPVLDEMFVAMKGHGAWRNGRPLQVREPAFRETAFLYVCSDAPWKYRFDGPAGKIRSLGCGAYHIGLVASGQGVLSLNCGPYVWDYTAPALVAQEAGAVVTTSEAEPLFPLRPGLDYGDLYRAVWVAASEKWLHYWRERIHRADE